MHILLNRLITVILTLLFIQNNFALTLVSLLITHYIYTEIYPNNYIKNDLTFSIIIINISSNFIINHYSIFYYIIFAFIVPSLIFKLQKIMIYLLSIKFLEYPIPHTTKLMVPILLYFTIFDVEPIKNYENYCMWNEHYTPMQEESKDDREGHDIVSDAAKNRLNENAEMSMQQSGVAGMYGIQQESKSFVESRINDHSDEAVQIFEESKSPGQSPGKHQEQLLEAQIEALNVDNTEAKTEDIWGQPTDVAKESTLQAFSNIVCSGTRMSHDDDLNDFDER